MSAPGGFVDKNYRSLPAHADLVDTSVIPEVFGFNDTLKLERPGYQTIRNCLIASHDEDCIDGVGVEGVEADRCELVIAGRNGITLKGGARDNSFTNLMFIGHGTEADIELGQFDNYWFPGRAPTRRNYFTGLGHLDQSPVRVRLWDADDSNTFQFSYGVKITRVPKVIWFPYFLFRYVQLRAVNLWLRVTRKTPVATKMA